MELILIGMHAGIGEIGALAFLWVFVEMLNPNAQRVARAQIAALVGTIALFTSWIIGGYYYVTFYGSNVKPLIKAGPMPWAHSVITETKEHVFLFLPILAILIFGLINVYRDSLAKGERNKSIVILSLLVFLISMAMAGMGYMITSGFRSAIT